MQQDIKKQANIFERTRLYICRAAKQPTVSVFLPFRCKTETDRAWKHLYLLIFWPLFLAVFKLAESGLIPREYHLIHCALDDMIPFCEYFILPYLAWFFLVGGMAAYTALFEKNVFERYMKFIIVTYSAALAVFFIYPSAQELRPVYFENPNFFTNMVLGIYSADTSTNICPSIHVIGAVAVLFAAFDSQRFSGRVSRAAFTVSTLAVCASTVFLKQHSVLDVLAALPVCAVGAALFYRERIADFFASRRAKKEKPAC